MSIATPSPGEYNGGDRATGAKTNIHAVRTKGVGSLAEVAAVVLETIGQLTVITRANFGDGYMLRNIRRTAND